MSTEAPLRRMLLLSRDRWPALLLGALAGAATVACGVALFAVSGWLIARASEHPDEVALAVAVVGVRAFGIGRGVFRYLERLVTHDAVFRCLVDLRVRLWQRLVRAFPAGLGDRHSGDVLARLTADVDAIQDLLIRGVTPPVVAALVGAGTVAMVLLVDVPAAGVLALGLLVAALAVPLVGVVASRAVAERTAADRGALAAGVTDLVDGLDELIAYGAVDRAVADVAAVDRRLLDGQRRWAWAGGAAAGLTTLVTGATVWALLVVAAAAQSHGSMGRTSTALVVLTGLAAFEATAPLATAAQQLMAVRASARRLTALLDAPEAIHEPVHPTPMLRTAVPHLELRDVSLRYGDNPVPALSHVSLDLPPGRRVALVGPSGAGKSSIAALLLRLREPSAGDILIDRVPVRQLAADDVRGVVGGALADAHVFDSTLRANVLLAKPNATEAELNSAAAAVHLSDWIAAQPLGWDTPVGTNGTQLSGGERQRLGLARALLADPAVLVLDEPTAHLDPVTRDRVLADVLAVAAGRTLVLITHDGTGLDQLDEVVHLDGGVVVGHSLARPSALRSPA